jgi:4-diphosphocytidyl-2-C-methyl-D-erythritol kinase
MTLIREFAPAKINLTLEIAGRRNDGMHLVESLVAFADAGDVVTLDTSEPAGLDATGPMAAGLAGPNILLRALELIAKRAPQLALGAVHLDKHLPVAAGIGGGSADAGALLRAVCRANGPASDGVDWHGLARALGADVPVCLDGRARWMTGIGDVLVDVLGGLPRLAAVLVNPRAAVPADKTARVFQALGAGPVRAGYAPPAPPRFPGREALVAFMRARGNALAGAAEAVVAETALVRTALEALPDIEHAAVSGAGPTCFGVFPNRDAAEVARGKLAAAHPSWWVVAVTLA